MRRSALALLVLWSRGSHFARLSTDHPSRAGSPLGSSSQRYHSQRLHAWLHAARLEGCDLRKPGPDLPQQNWGLRFLRDVRAQPGPLLATPLRQRSFGSRSLPLPLSDLSSKAGGARGSSDSPCLLLADGGSGLSKVSLRSCAAALQTPSPRSGTKPPGSRMPPRSRCLALAFKKGTWTWTSDRATGWQEASRSESRRRHQGAPLSRHLEPGTLSHRSRLEVLLERSHEQLGFLDFGLLLPGGLEASE